MAEVTATTNLGYVVVGVLTLGIYLPMTLEWRCAKDPVRDGHGLE